MKILVTNTKGGCGKSTLTACLAEAMGGEVVDFDPQGTITVNAELTGRFIPKPYQDTTSEVVIYDTPPYNSQDLDNLIKEVDVVVIPSKLMYADLLSIATLVDKLERLKATKKAIIVFNEVRHHNRKLNDEVHALFMQEYPNLNLAKTELPNWLGFAKVLAEPLPERERETIFKLVKELNAHKNGI